MPHQALEELDLQHVQSLQCQIVELRIERFECQTRRLLSWHAEDAIWQDLFLRQKDRILRAQFYFTG